MIGLICYTLFYMLFGYKSRCGLKGINSDKTIHYSMSMFNAIVLTVFSGIVCWLNPDQYYPDNLSTTAYYVSLNLTNSFCGFLLADLLMSFYTKLYKGWDIIVHHSLFLIVSQINVYREYNACILWWLTSAELSTIFLTIRHILKDRNESVWWVNPAFALSFILTRGVVYGYGLWHMFYNSTRLAAGEYIEICIFTLLAALFVLNLYWMSMIVKRAFTKH